MVPVSGCIVVSTGSATSSPPGSKTPNLCTVIGTPWTCAPERPVRHGLDSGYIATSSGSATPSPPGSMVQNLYAGVPFTMYLFTMDLFVVVL